MKKTILLLLIKALLAAKDHAIIINELEVHAGSPPGLGLATVDAGVSFNVAPGSSHPHNSILNVESIVVQGKRLGDGSWKTYYAGASCLGKIEIGEQLRIKGAINKKIHIFCQKTKLKD